MMNCMIFCVCSSVFLVRSTTVAIGNHVSLYDLFMVPGSGAPRLLLAKFGFSCSYLSFFQYIAGNLYLSRQSHVNMIRVRFETLCSFYTNVVIMEKYSFQLYAVSAFLSRIILKRLNIQQISIFRKLERSSRTIIKAFADIRFKKTNY